jgi:hypothetical protein
MSDMRIDTVDSDLPPFAARLDYTDKHIGEMEREERNSDLLCV